MQSIVGNRFFADAPFNRVLHEFARTSEGELFLYMSLIGFDGLYAEVQSLGNLTGSVAFANQTKDLEFTVRQFRYG